MKTATTHDFKAFPEFSKLTWAHKEKYDKQIINFPPIYDISFQGLMCWWNPLNNMAISKLNDNLVVPYWLPGDDADSGLSLIGTHQIDESICTIFDNLRARNEPVRLVNVPEFVISNIKYHDMFRFTENRDLSEYVMPLKHFYPLKNMSEHWRKEVKKSLQKVGADALSVRSLDLHTAKDRELLLEVAGEWRAKNGLNDFGKIEGESIESAVLHTEILEMENLCLFVNGELWGFCLYQVPHDKHFIIMKHIKATHKSTVGFELLAYTFAKELIGQGFAQVNLGPDYGLEHLRMFMLTIGTDNFFRKYTIEPKE